MAYPRIFVSVKSMPFQNARGSLCHRLSKLKVRNKPLKQHATLCIRLRSPELIECQ